MSFDSSLSSSSGCFFQRHSDSFKCSSKLTSGRRWSLYFIINST